MISVIITTYKRPAWIVKRAAQSVLNQTYKNLELIIVDDSPKDFHLRDDVKNMSTSLGERVTYLQHEENAGACAARNTGLKVAKGEFVAFLDDDDEWLPDKLMKQLELIEKNKDVALVYCGWYIYYSQEKRQVVQKLKYYRGNVFKKLLLENFIGSTSFPLIRKSVLDSVGGFNEDMKASQDYEVWLKIAKDFLVDFVDEPLVRYYVHDGEQITKNRRIKYESIKKIDDAYDEYLKKQKMIYSRRKYNLSIHCATFDINEARKIFVDAFINCPVPTLTFFKAIKWLYVVPIFKKF